jgi:hypothetical protein
MAKTHVVKQGEHATGIAERYGFRDYKTVWEDGANAALAKNRNPHVLHPRDEVAVPDKVVKKVPKPTTETHRFRIATTKLFLRVKLRDFDFNEVKSAKYEVVISAADVKAPRKGSTDGSGILKEEFDRPFEPIVDVEVRVTVVPGSGTPQDHKFDLRVGHLNPKHKLSGQQARLNNLGYFAGFDVEDLQQFLWAVEEFQEDHILLGKSKVKKTPKIIDETDDPNTPTGVIDDAAFLEKLVEIHGC